MTENHGMVAMGPSFHEHHSQRDTTAGSVSASNVPTVVTLRTLLGSRFQAIGWKSRGVCRRAVEKKDKIPVIAGLRRTKLTVVAATSTWRAERIHDELYGLSYENLRSLYFWGEQSSQPGIIYNASRGRYRCTLQLYCRFHSNKNCMPRKNTPRVKYVRHSN